MLNSKVLGEKIAAELDRVAAVNALCEKESRDATEAEQAVVNEAIGPDGKGGNVAKLRASLAQAEAFEAEIANQARLRLNNRVPAVGVHQGASDSDSQSMFARVKVPAAAAPRGPIKSFKGPDADKQAYAFGQFVFALTGRKRANEWCKDALGIDVRNGMTEGTDSEGGYLVPAEFEATLIRLVNDYGSARANFGVRTMTRDTLDVPRRTGGATAYFIGETSAPTASTPTGDLVKLVAKKLGVLATYSRDLSDDAAIEVGGHIMDEAALALAYKEDLCGFLGDGTSTYGGMVGLKNAIQAGSVYTAITGNTAFSTLDLEDFEGMVAKMPSYGFRGMGPKWYIHRSGWASSMLRLAAAAGGNTTREIAGGASQVQFLGYPVVFVEAMNNTLTTQTSTAGLCYFANLDMGTFFGNRRGVTMEQTNEVYFTSQQTAVLATERFDVNVHDIGTASAAGCIIGLTTPGS